jgi:predicted TIM-barrel fold metal-dependent hydrolase
MSVQTAPEISTQKTRLSIYDTDVHHAWDSARDVVPYLPADHRERFEKTGIDVGTLALGRKGGVRGLRVDVASDERRVGGEETASDSLDLTRRQLLDGCGVDWALLTSGPVGTAATLHYDLDYGNALISAWNDYSVEQWVGADDRFRFAIAINPRDPDSAVAEIERHARNPHVVGVMLFGGSHMPHGQRYFKPVHEACVEHDLVWTIHFAAEGLCANPAPSAAGQWSSYAEERLNRSASYKAHLASFVFEGVFERYPTFKVAILESGFGWVPSFLWSMDSTWLELRGQTPIVKRPPSEYIVRQVRFASQPEEEPTVDDGLENILEWMHAEQTLMFATDYPHWDWDDPAETFKALKPTLRERIFTANAREFFRS